MLVGLKRQAASCTDCELHETRTQVVFGSGNENSPLMFIGEGPGREEDVLGFPFIGASGQVLSNLMLRAGIRRKDVYCTNAVRCRPWCQSSDDKLRCENRPPTPVELAACKTWLDQEIAAVSPKVIVCVGEKAGRVVLGRNVSVAKDGRRWHSDHEYSPTLVRIVYHPAYIMRQRGEERAKLEDSLVAEIVEAAATARRMITSDD